MGHERSNAALIVRAVNSHDDLMAALEEVRQACLFDEDNNQIGVTTEPHISEVLFEKICAVLAKAQSDDPG